MSKFRGKRSYGLGVMAVGSRMKTWKIGEIVKFMSVFNFGTLLPKSVSIFGTLPPKLDSDTKLHNFGTLPPKLDSDPKLHHFGTLLPKCVTIFGSQPPKLGLTCTVLLLSLISYPFTSFAHNRLKTQSHLFTKHSSFSQGTCGDSLSNTSILCSIILNPS